MLFVVMLGGKHPRAKIEVHDVVFVVADTLEATYPQLREDWFGSPKGVHIDSWMAVDGVDGWKVEFSPLAPAAGAHHLYFINLGGYEANSFGEAHHYLLVVARTKQEAKSKGKHQMLRHWSQAHTDGVLDVDDCLPIDLVDGRYVHLVQGPHRPIRQQNDYIVLSWPPTRTGCAGGTSMCPPSGRLHADFNFKGWVWPQATLAVLPTARRAAATAGAAAPG